MFFWPPAEALPDPPQLRRWLGFSYQAMLWPRLLWPGEKPTRDPPVLALAHPRLPLPLLVPLLRGLLLRPLEVGHQKEGESEPISCGSAHYGWWLWSIITIWSGKNNQTLTSSNINIQYLGDYQTTEYAEDGIIVPKLFYKNSKDVKTEKAINDIISEADLRLIKEKITANDDLVIEEEDLSRDLEILQESNSKKIITEIVLQPQAWSERSGELMTRRTSNVPIIDDPERPLEAMYQPSVPVVQVGAKNAKSYFWGWPSFPEFTGLGPKLSTEAIWEDSLPSWICQYVIEAFTFHKILQDNLNSILIQ